MSYLDPSFYQFSLSEPPQIDDNVLIYGTKLGIRSLDLSLPGAYDVLHHLLIYLASPDTSFNSLRCNGFTLRCEYRSNSRYWYKCKAGTKEYMGAASYNVARKLAVQAVSHV